MNQLYFNFGFTAIKGKDLRSIFRKGVGASALALLEELLQYDPEARIRPLEACAHHFFDDLRDERKRCPDGQPLPSELFNLTSRELRVCNKNVQERLVPVWHSN